MEESKKYLVTNNPDNMPEIPTLYNSYVSALEIKEQLEDMVGGNWRIYKVETKITEATHSSEDYWYYG